MFIFTDINHLSFFLISKAVYTYFIIMILHKGIIAHFMNPIYIVDVYFII